MNNKTLGQIGFETAKNHNHYIGEWEHADVSVKIRWENIAKSIIREHARRILNDNKIQRIKDAKS